MELLKQLYEIYSPSGGEKKLKRFIKHWVKENIQDAVIRTDNNDGNIYITRGDSESYPCVVAHLDQVQKNHSADFVAVETDDIIFGYSPTNRRREGLGADDKNGIWVALQCLKEFDILKVAFFVGEEIGCVGSGRCDLLWFRDCQYIIEPDRRGSSDLITDICGSICSDDFKEYIPMEEFGYSETSGMMTDVLELSERGVGLSCINLSCGYYEPHTDNEFTVKEDLINCLGLVKAVINNCGCWTFDHKYKYAYASRYRSYGGYDYYDYYDDYGDDKFDDIWGDDVKTPRVSSLFSEPTILPASSYLTAQKYIEDMIISNCEMYFPDELYPYMASDLETFGVTQEEFLEIAEPLWEFYTNQRRIDNEIDF
jgi:hypothetical protein